MIRTNGALVITLVGLTGAVPAAAQQDFATQKSALREIRETAADICYTVEQKGQKSEAQLSGEVQAKVTGVLAKLAALGVKGAGKVGSTEYQGLPQEAVETALTASLNCRERVFNKLVERMMPSGAVGRPSDPVPPSPAPNPPPGNMKKISVGPFAIGDSIEQVRTSGIQGEFEISKDGHTGFKMPIQIPIGDASFYLNKRGYVIYRFTNKIVDLISVAILDAGGCDSVDFRNISWSKFLLSQTMQELGEPIQPPSQHKEVFPILGQPFSENVTEYAFSAKGEGRIIEIADATGANNWSQRACLFVSTVYDAARPLPP